MKKWEYKAIEGTDLYYPGQPEKIEKIINEIGNDGWELVAITLSTGDATRNMPMLFFKKSYTKRRKK